MESLSARILGAYRRLLKAYGPQGWWPSEGPLETMVGAVLTQHTAWQNAERALAALRARGLLSLPALVSIPEKDLALVVRQSGSFRRKAATIKALVEAIGPRPSDLDRFLSLERIALRRALLRVRGVGPETADAISLYAAAVPVFVVDAYTRRVAERHGFARAGATYAEVQAAFEGGLPGEAGLFAEYHALLVRVGRERCRTRPICRGCPLESDLATARGGRRARASCRSRARSRI